MKDEKLEYFKKQILAILDKQQKKETKEIKKALNEMETEHLYKRGCFIPIGQVVELYEVEMQKAGYPVGTIREWKGKKHIKIAPNKWRPMYENESRGAKMSIKALMKKVANCFGQYNLDYLLNSKGMFDDDTFDFNMPVRDGKNYSWDANVVATANSNYIIMPMNTNTGTQDHAPLSYILEHVKNPHTLFNEIKGKDEAKTEQKVSELSSNKTNPEKVKELEAKGLKKSNPFNMW